MVIPSSTCDTAYGPSTLPGAGAKNQKLAMSLEPEVSQEHRTRSDP